MAEAETTTIYVRTDTRDKFRKLAELDRRDLVSELDCVASDELSRRGFDPDTLQLVKADEPIGQSGGDES